MHNENMEAAIKSKIDQWLSNGYDQSTKDQIQKLLDEKQEDELVDSFYKDLEFGTGGLRGIMGVGSNRMNKYTIGTATQGLSNYLIKSFPNQELSAVIAYDSRNNSRFFAETTAAVFSANGIKVYLFSELRPTPQLSFAIRHLNAQTGVVITASHNPKEYNGYKAYWNDGAQVIAPHDKNIIDEVQAISDIAQVNFDKNSDLIIELDEKMDTVYLDMIHSLSVSPESIQNQSDLNIVFSPIHGTGITLVPDVLKKFGFNNVNVVKEQSEPNGNFPTVVYPNPEEKEAMTLALQQAKNTNADLVLATDPDSDRVGIAVKNLDNEFQLLNGNQTGSLLMYYMLDAWKTRNKLTGKEFVVKTVVTSNLMDTIAKSYSVDCYNTLTGFKFIAGLIRDLEGQKQFIVGGEESYGYLVGDSVRDKDAIASCAFIAEMTAYFKNNGKSIYETLIELYVKYGFFRERLISLTKKGKSGAEEIESMMTQFRSNPPQVLAGSKVVKVIDYGNSTSLDLVNGNTESIDFPKSNVLQFLTEDETKVSARPSGTEPKIKFYFSVREDLKSADEYKNIESKLDDKIDTIINELKL